MQGAVTDVTALRARECHHENEMVRFPVSGASSLHVQFNVPLDSVFAFIVIPPAVGFSLRYVGLL
jgi:hypothetical protein